MANPKILASDNDKLVIVNSPVSEEELTTRRKDYILLTPVAFAKKYRIAWSEPVAFQLKDGTRHEIQINRCDNPFCKWYGLPQEKFNNIKNKPSRYKLSGVSGAGSKFVCNPVPSSQQLGTTWDCVSAVLSNWAVAEEIKRLIKVNTVVPKQPDYTFHHPDCQFEDSTPINNKKMFYSRGLSISKSKRWQCKECKKLTHVEPSRHRSTTYHQQRNEVLHRFAHLLLNKTPVRRTCEVLDMGAQTYYSKLEWLYRCCLEFLEKHETPMLRSKIFHTLWLNTDQMIYYLNNLKRPGQGNKFVDLEAMPLQTKILITGDLFSRYVFRADVAYDWDISIEDIVEDTKKYKDDHLYEFVRKNARFRHSFAPQPPTELDTQTKDEYRQALNEFARREMHIKGLHVNSTYTAIAHYWLIRNLLKVKNWRFITDEDHSLLTAMYRTFTQEITIGDAHHFLCKIEHYKSLKQAFVVAEQAKKDLRNWGIENVLQGYTPRELAHLKMLDTLKTHSFHQYVNVNGRDYPKWARNHMQHPLPNLDQGIRWIDCTTNISTYDIEEVASMLMKVNNTVTNAFIQQIRRRISSLERPLTTARGDGKSYIYANFNPKYAQYALTILRTYYNFCEPFKTTHDSRKATPAQRLGLTDRIFDLRDIIYQ